jgi:SpoVK/Ycf46/Vps4 family AAA+-type ATPase
MRFSFYFCLLFCLGLFPSNYLKNPLTVDFSLIKKSNNIHPLIYGVPTSIILSLAVALLARYILGSLSKNYPSSGLINLFNPKRIDNNIFCETKITYKEIIGYEKAKTELKKLSCILKGDNAKLFDKCQINKPSGIIFYGPPGNGKTTFAEAFATDSGFCFVKVSAATFVNRYVGTGANKVKELFTSVKEKMAKENKGCVFLIDEADSIIQRDGVIANSSTGNEYSNVTNQMILEIDNLKNCNKKIIVILATNFLEKLDDAMIRNGRFDTKIEIGPPSKEDIKNIIKHYLKKHTVKILGENENDLIKNYDDDLIKDSYLKEKLISCADIEVIIQKIVKDNIYDVCENKEQKDKDIEEKLKEKLVNFDFCKKIEEELFFLVKEKKILNEKKKFKLQ